MATLPSLRPHRVGARLGLLVSVSRARRVTGLLEEPRAQPHGGSEVRRGQPRGSVGGREAGRGQSPGRGGGVAAVCG